MSRIGCVFFQRLKLRQRAKDRLRIAQPRQSIVRQPDSADCGQGLMTGLRIDEY